ncbi:MAG: S-layer homology domain-containing protein [Anaerovoracaceae bacterium]
MKKIISIILTAAMTLTLSAPAVFAEEVSNTAAGAGTFTDVAGTSYEGAAAALSQAGILTGFPDGTFRPEDGITRAQACTMITRAFPELGGAAAVSFTDVAEDSWAAEYIRACVAGGIVNGYPDGSFKPDANVTNYELITMLVRAIGLADDEAMTWPSDYVAAAQGVDMLKHLTALDLDKDGNRAASRGDAALMVCGAADIDTAVDPGTTDPSQPAEPENPSSGDNGSADQPGDTVEKNILSDFSGNAYGLILSTGQALNSKGDSVGMMEFLMGDKTYTLMERSSNSGAIGTNNSASGLVKVTLSNGEIRSVTPMYDVKSPEDKAHVLTPVTGSAISFYKVKDAGKTYAYYYDESGTETYVGINQPVVVYTCEADGSDINYELGSVSDIREDCYIAAFMIDKDSGGVADVVLVIDEDEVADLLELSANAAVGTFR